SFEHTLVDVPARAIVEAPLLPTLRGVPVSSDRGDHDELGCDAPRFGQKALALLVLEVTVEVTREDAVERPVFEREGERVSMLETRRRNLAARDLEHALAGVEADDVSAEVPGQKARTARDVQRPYGRKLSNHALESSKLVFPAGPHVVSVQPLTQPPVVVLERAPVVVRLATFVEHVGWSCRSSRCRTSGKE